MGAGEIFGQTSRLRDEAKFYRVLSFRDLDEHQNDYFEYIFFNKKFLLSTRQRRKQGRTKLLILLWSRYIYLLLHTEGKSKSHCKV